jgi:hypothetical protein
LVTDAYALLSIAGCGTLVEIATGISNTAVISNGTGIDAVATVAESRVGTRTTTARTGSVVDITIVLVAIGPAGCVIVISSGPIPSWIGVEPAISKASITPGVKSVGVEAPAVETKVSKTYCYGESASTEPTVTPEWVPSPTGIAETWLVTKCPVVETSGIPAPVIPTAPAYPIAVTEEVIVNQYGITRYYKRVVVIGIYVHRIIVTKSVHRTVETTNPRGIVEIVIVVVIVLIGIVIAINLFLTCSAIIRIAVVTITSIVIIIVVITLVGVGVVIYIVVLTVRGDCPHTEEKYGDYSANAVHIIKFSSKCRPVAFPVEFAQIKNIRSQ